MSDVDLFSIIDEKPEAFFKNEEEKNKFLERWREIVPNKIRKNDLARAKSWRDILWKILN